MLCAPHVTWSWDQIIRWILWSPCTPSWRTVLMFYTFQLHINTSPVVVRLMADTYFSSHSTFGPLVYWFSSFQTVIGLRGFQKDLKTIFQVSVCIMVDIFFIFFFFFSFNPLHYYYYILCIKAVVSFLKIPFWCFCCFK